jgi:hypothetical protein
MNNLSPAAQAVWESFNEEEAGVFVDYGQKLAAALDALADQVLPEEPAPEGMRPAGEVYSAREIRRRQRQDIRAQLLAIANELKSD